MTRKGKFLVISEPLMELAKMAGVENELYLQKWILACSTTNDENMARDIEDHLRTAVTRELQRRLANPLDLPNPANMLEGVGPDRAILIGWPEGLEVPFAHPIDDLAKGTYIAGATGSGKSNLMKSVSMQTAAHCPCWWIDREKAEYRYLVRWIPDLWIIDVARELPWNFFEPPPGVDPRHWVVAIAVVFAKTHGLMDASEAMLQTALMELFSQLGVFDGSRQYPTLRDLVDHLKAMDLRGRYRSAQFRDTLLNRLEAWLAISPCVGDYVRGVSIEDLANHHVVFEVRGLTERQGRFFVSALLLALQKLREASGDMDGRLRNAVFIDEAHWSFPDLHNDAVGTGSLAGLMATARSSGVGMVLADQVVTDLDPAVLQHTALKIGFRLGDGRDLDRFASALALKPEQRDHLRKLPVGEAVAAIPGLTPFLIRVPKVRDLP